MLCVLQRGTARYAAFRTSVSFTGLTTTDDRDFLWNAYRQGACSGGYNTTVYAALADAVAAQGLTVAYNSESQCIVHADTDSPPTLP